MKSLSELNTFAAQSLVLNDARKARVIFDRTRAQPQVLTIASRTFVLPVGINIQEIINYSTANVRYTLTIKTGYTNPMTTSTLSFATMPSGCTLTSTPGVSYTVSGIKNVSDWNVIKNPSWILPVNYTSFPIFYIEARLTYYDEDLGVDVNQTCDIYDPIYYPLTFAEGAASMSIAPIKTARGRSAMSVGGFIWENTQNIVPGAAALTARATLWHETFPIKGFSISTNSAFTESASIKRFRGINSTFSTAFNVTAKGGYRKYFASQMSAVFGPVGSGGVPYLEGNGFPYYDLNGNVTGLGVFPGITRIRQGTASLISSFTMTTEGADARLMNALIASSGTMSVTPERKAGLFVNATVTASATIAPIATHVAHSTMTANGAMLSMLTGPSHGEAAMTSSATMNVTALRIQKSAVVLSSAITVSASAMRKRNFPTAMTVQASLSSIGMFYDPLTINYTITNTTSNNGVVRTIYLPLGGTVSCRVDWGDGTIEEHYTAGIKTHQYSSIGAKTVKVSRINPVGTDLEIFGAIPGTYISGDPGYSVSLASTYLGSDYIGPANNLWLTGITKFGNLGITKIPAAFSTIGTITTAPSILPSSITDISLASIPNNTNIVSWDTSNITKANYAFSTTFNQAIGSWNVSSLTDARYMFSTCSAFNQPLNSWNVSNVTNMNGMFSSCSTFNQSLNSWNVSNVTNMASMFSQARAFNGNITSWNTSAVTTMGSMFYDARAFNQNITSWNTANVTSMSGMFQLAGAFNQPIGSWNVSNVTNMSAMFSLTTTFNQSLSSWNTVKVTDMTYMFYYAAAFDQNISGWHVPLITTKPTEFDTATLSTWITAEKPIWGNP